MKSFLAPNWGALETFHPIAITAFSTPLRDVVIETNPTKLTPSPDEEQSPPQTAHDEIVIHANGDTEIQKPSAPFFQTAGRVRHPLFGSDTAAAAETLQDVDKLKAIFIQASASDAEARTQLLRIIFFIGQLPDVRQAERLQWIRQFNVAKAQWMRTLESPLDRQIDVGLTSQNFTKLDLCGLDLSFLDLRHARFRDCNLAGTYFTRSDLRGVRVRFADDGIVTRPIFDHALIDRMEWDENWSQFFPISSVGSVSARDMQNANREAVAKVQSHAMATLKTVHEAGFLIFKDEAAKYLSFHNGQQIFAGQTQSRYFWVRFLALAEKAGLDPCLLASGDELFVFLPSAILAWHRFYKIHSPNQPSRERLRQKVAEEFRMPAEEVRQVLQRLSESIDAVLKSGTWDGRRRLDRQLRGPLRDGLGANLKELLALLSQPNA